MPVPITESPYYQVALPPGTVLRSERREYEVEDVLGRPGGFGIVYLARAPEENRQVAIKEYLPRDVASRGVDRTTVVPYSPHEAGLFQYGLSKFLEEARILYRIRHDNVIGVQDFFPANGTAYMVMDYHPGRTLWRLLERRRIEMNEPTLPYPTAIQIMLRVLNGLDTAHRANILHCDIKPENIYLLHSGRVILLDFGAARQAVGEKSQTLARVLTPGYAPVEQYGGSSRQGPWTDVYACAATLYRAIVGLTPPESHERQTEDTLQPPRSLVPDLPRAVEDAILQGLAVNRQSRPQTAAEYQDMLQAALEYGPVVGKWGTAGVRRGSSSEGGAAHPEHDGGAGRQSGGRAVGGATPPPSALSTAGIAAMSVAGTLLVLFLLYVLFMA